MSDLELLPEGSAPWPEVIEDLFLRAVEQAEAGQATRITRRGEVVAVIGPGDTVSRPERKD